MAKVQGKKAASQARRAGSKAVSRVRAVVRSKKRPAPRKPAPARSAKPAKAGKPAKPAKKPAKLVKVAKAATKTVKKATKVVVAKAAKVAKAVAPVKPAKRPAVVARPTVVPPVAKIAAPRPAAAPARPAAEPKKGRVRRLRPRVHSNGAPVANWLPPGAEKPRPSSFIPAPPRAEAPSLIAAPPASSDRLIRPEDVTEFVTRTVPVRVDVEQGGGKVFISVNPLEVSLRVGEGIEWDFRYIGGADVTVDELIVEFEKPVPFAHGSFRSRKPGTARPHRQLSGPAQKSAAGRRGAYVIKAMTPFKTEIAVARLVMTILP